MRSPISEVSYVRPRRSVRAISVKWLVVSILHATCTHRWFPAARAISEILVCYLWRRRHCCRHGHHHRLTRCPNFSKMNRSIVTAFDEVLDLRFHGGELWSRGFLLHWPLEHSEWKSVSALSAIEEVVCRMSNKLFVGLPLISCMFSSHSSLPCDS